MVSRPIRRLPCKPGNSVEQHVTRKRVQATYRDVDDTLDTPFVVFLKDGPNLLGVCQVTPKAINVRTLLVCFGRVLGERIAYKFCDMGQRGRVRIMVVVD